MDRTHFKKTGTMVCTIRHGQGKRWLARWVGEGLERSKSFAKKADAERHLHQVVSELQTGTYADPKRSAVAFGTVAESWFKNKEAANKAPKTVGGYRGLLDVVILPKWENFPLRDIDHERLQDWITWLSKNPAARKHPKRDKDGEVIETGLSPARVIQIHQVVHEVFDYAIRTKYVAANPADRIELPRKPRSKEIALTHKQVRRLADEMIKAQAAVRQRADTKPSLVRPDGLAAMVLLLAYGGLRFGEYASLRVGDVDTDRRRMMVSKSITQVRQRGRIEGDTKTHQKRSVPILTTDLNDALAKTVAVATRPSSCSLGRTETR